MYCKVGSAWAMVAQLSRAMHRHQCARWDQDGGVAERGKNSGAIKGTPASPSGPDDRGLVGRHYLQRIAELKCHGDIAKFVLRISRA